MASWAADAVLALHAAFAGFVVFGLGLVWLGRAAGWRFVGDPWFRLTHLGAMAAVLAEQLAGIVCPLTAWESALRRAAGGEGYAGSFVGHWLGRLLYYDLPDWAFTLLYAGFFVLVLASLRWVPIRFRPRPGRGGASGGGRVP